MSSALLWWTKGQEGVYHAFKTQNLVYRTRSGILCSPFAVKKSPLNGAVAGVFAPGLRPAGVCTQMFHLS